MLVFQQACFRERSQYRSAIGTASEAIRGFAISEEQKQLLVGHVAVADAICYIFGTIGVIFAAAQLGRSCLVSTFGQKQKRKKRARNSPDELGVSSGWQPIGFRAYKVPQNAPIVGKTVDAAEKSVTDGGTIH